MPQLLAWFCSSSTTANYEGHYTVEAACVIPEQHKVFYFQGVQKQQAVVQLTLGRIFLMSNLEVCQNSMITELL